MTRDQPKITIVGDMPKNMGLIYSILSIYGLPPGVLRRGLSLVRPRQYQTHGEAIEALARWLQIYPLDLDPDLYNEIK